MTRVCNQHKWKGKRKSEEEEEEKEIDDDPLSHDPQFDILKKPALTLNKKEKAPFKKAFDLNMEIDEKRSKRIKRQVLRKTLRIFENLMP